MTLDDLRKDFMLKYPKIDYFTLNEVFRFGDMAYCLGIDADKDSHKRRSKRVRRSDGIVYKSITEAANKNMAARQNIVSALKHKWKSAGYYWSYV